jgi:hypothetical protein
MISQAKELSQALKAIGLRHGSWKTDGDFTVKTERTRKIDRSNGGYLRYTLYGDALAHPQNRRANEVIAENADRLVREFGLSVILVESERNGERRVSAVVSTRWNRNRAVSILRDGEWTYRTVSAVEEV